MLPLAAFGSTGHQSTRVIFGAAALAAMTPDRAAETLDQVHSAGINHIDTAASYGDSELRLAPWLAEHRHQVFLATKTGLRNGSEARAQLEASLGRLGTKQVDLIQLHNLVESEEWELAMGPGGALEALIAARDEGLCRFIGVTGHGLRIPAMHLRSLERFSFDSVLVPYNYSLLSIDSYARDLAELLTQCSERGIAVQTIKSLARRRWPEGTKRQFSWYQPIEDRDAIDRAVRYVLSQPQLFLNTSSDARLLDAVLDTAAGPLNPPAESELQADVARLEIAPLFDGAALETVQ